MSNFFNKTPYTDFHELNLDWLLERVNNIKDHVKGMQDDIIYLQEHTPDMDDYYDKTETDALLADKADVSDLPDMTDYYDKTETDALLADKADVSDLPDMTDYYDKTETDALLADKADVSSLATVATTGAYADLTGQPTIPAAQVNSDWNANSGVAQILNKPRALKEYYQNWSVPILAGNEYTDVTLNFQQSYQTVPLVHFQVRTSTGDRGNVPVAVIYSLTATTVVIRVWRQVGATTGGGIVPAIDIFIYE